MGEALQVLGGVGPNNTQYTVQVDDGKPYVLNANASDFIPSSTLVSIHHLVVEGRTESPFRSLVLYNQPRFRFPPSHHHQ